MGPSSDWDLPGLVPIGVGTYWHAATNTMGLTCLPQPQAKACEAADKQDSVQNRCGEKNQDFPVEMP